MKSFKIVFSAHIGTLKMAVKFPCKIKMLWKRSNETAETALISLNQGKAIFDQTLRLNVNMYFDPTTNKFIQKKCLFSFLILTQKGQKSAGSITFDLAQFFRRQVRQIKQVFTLEKCPVKETTVDIVMHYDQSTETAFDAMSTVSQSMNVSVSALDLSQIKDNFKGDSPVKKASATTDFQTQSQSSTVQDSTYQERGLSYGIKSIANVTGKINQFVNKNSRTIKYEFQQHHRKQSQLESQLLSSKQITAQLQKQLQGERLAKAAISLEFNNYRDQSQSRAEDLRRQAEEHKEQTKIMSVQMQEGKSEQETVQALIGQHQQQLSKIKGQLEQNKSMLLKEKKQKNIIAAKCQEMENQLTQVKNKYQLAQEKYQDLEQEIKKRQKQLEDTRIGLEKAYDKMVEAYGSFK